MIELIPKASLSLHMAIRILKSPIMMIKLAWNPRSPEIRWGLILHCNFNHADPPSFLNIHA